MTTGNCCWSATVKNFFSKAWGKPWFACPLAICVFTGILYGLSAFFSTSGVEKEFAYSSGEIDHAEKARRTEFDPENPLVLNQFVSDLKSADMIIAIGNDGIIPAGLVQKKLCIPMEIITINYRDENNNPVKDYPELLSRAPRYKGKRILIADLMTRTGKTFEKAKEVLKGNTLKTFAINGKADYSLYDFPGCINWPWN